MHQTAVTIKIVLFSCIENSLRVFLRDNMLPKGDIVFGEPINSTVKQIVQVCSGIVLKSEYNEQLYSYVSFDNKISRVTIVYYVLIPHFCIAETDRNYWHILRDLKLSHEDKQIVTYALQRLQWKLEYTNVVYSLLPGQFTFRELQQTYEAILHKKLDKRNFRKKVVSLKLLKQTSSVRHGEISRPAKLYSFIHRSPVITNIFS